MCYEMIIIRVGVATYGLELFELLLKAWVRSKSRGGSGI